MKQKLVMTLIAVMAFVSALGGGASLLASVQAQAAPTVVAWGRIVQPVPHPAPAPVPPGGGGDVTPDGNSWGG